MSNELDRPTPDINEIPGSTDFVGESTLIAESGDVLSMGDDGSGRAVSDWEPEPEAGASGFADVPESVMDDVGESISQSLGESVGSSSAGDSVPSSSAGSDDDDGSVPAGKVKPSARGMRNRFIAGGVVLAAAAGFGAWALGMFDGAPAQDAAAPVLPTPAGLPLPAPNGVGSDSGASAPDAPATIASDPMPQAPEASPVSDAAAVPAQVASPVVGVTQEMPATTAAPAPATKPASTPLVDQDMRATPAPKPKDAPRRDTLSFPERPGAVGQDYAPAPVEVPPSRTAEPKPRAQPTHNMGMEVHPTKKRTAQSVAPVQHDEPAPVRRKPRAKAPAEAGEVAREQRGEVQPRQPKQVEAAEQQPAGVPTSSLRLRMVANGLAWVEQDNGVSVVLREGDVLPGVGKVTSIDSGDGVVRFGKHELR